MNKVYDFVRNSSRKVYKVKCQRYLHEDVSQRSNLSVTGLCLENELVDMLIKHRFFKSSSHFFPGLLGKEVINNLRLEWWRCTVMGREDILTLEEPMQGGRKFDEERVFQEIIRQTLHCELSGNLPLTVALNVVCKNDYSDTSEWDETTVLAMFVDSTSSQRKLESLHSEQVKWIRKYVRKPARVVSVWAANNDNGTAKKGVDVKYQQNNSNIITQHSSLVHGHALKHLPGWEEIERHFGCCPSLILVKHNLYNLFITVMLDSYHTINFPNYKRIMMRIHPHIAPVKTAVYIKGCKSKELLQLASELVHFLRGLGASCWNASEIGLSLEDLDESGVMYGVEIDGSTLEGGMLQLRNRDNSLKVPTHVSELQKKILKYLEPS